jgi:hypothetical protein
LVSGRQNVVTARNPVKAFGVSQLSGSCAGAANGSALPSNSSQEARRVPLSPRISLVTVPVLVTVALGLSGPRASAHRIDLAGARAIADWIAADDYTGRVRCSRRTDHRVRCYQEYEDTDLDTWTQRVDFSLVGWRLYMCSPWTSCTKPLTTSYRFVGRTRSGRADLDVELAARGAGGYFVPYEFSLSEGDVRVPCKFGDGHVEGVSLSLEGHIRNGRTNARYSYAWDKDGDGVSESHTVERLSGSVTPNRLSAVAQTTVSYGDGTSCSGKQSLTLHPIPKVPRYIEP